ncbi:hypothetical protein MML48_1g09248 [Holotrichia oblita]|uniref:Uncharacterized protein n=1 Tax=Holotrichia oblita TaxID=644536 RepID=A0ACB9U012_HOLOL|nr:hypothetical protein MML48_1g09248 [Holotrichia oblita]
MILFSLRFFAAGSYQRSLEEEYNFDMAQSTMHKCIHRIADAINDNVVKHKIRFPSADERTRIRANFLNKYGFPGVVGVVDGTHLAVLKPAVDEQNFINRKGFRSLNWQIICDDEA